MPAAEEMNKAVNRSKKKRRVTGPTTITQNNSTPIRSERQARPSEVAPSLPGPVRHSASYERTLNTITVHTSPQSSPVTSVTPLAAVDHGYRPIPNPYPNQTAPAHGAADRRSLLGASLDLRYGTLPTIRPLPLLGSNNGAHRGGALLDGDAQDASNSSDDEPLIRKRPIRVISID